MTAEIPKNNTSQSERLFSPSEYGENLVSLRRSRRLSQSELARRMNITPSALLHWEKGRLKRPLSQSRLLTLEQTLNLTADEIEPLKDPFFRRAPNPDYQTAIFNMHLDDGSEDGYRVTTPLVVPRSFDDHDVRFILNNMQKFVDKYLKYKKTSRTN